MLSIYDSNSSIDDRIHYLKFYETYDGVATNQKLHQILIEYKSKYSEVMEKIIDAILYTRNIHSGRGLRDLTYSYLLTLQNFIPMKAVFILYMLVNNNIGSWRDIRTYCEFLAKEKGRNEPFIRPIICLYNHQLLKDHAAFNAGKPISYAAKWVPRETKGRGWLFDILVSLYDDPEYKAIRADATDAAMRKCKMMYRKMVSKLNKHLDTLEIKQCANEWATIDPASLSTSQLYNGANAFTRTGTEDRAKCASTFDAEYKKKAGADYAEKIQLQCADMEIGQTHCQVDWREKDGRTGCNEFTLEFVCREPLLKKPGLLHCNSRCIRINARKRIIYDHWNVLCCCNQIVFW